MAAGVAHPHDELVIELQDVDLDADGVRSPSAWMTALVIASETATCSSVRAVAGIPASAAKDATWRRTAPM